MIALFRIRVPEDWLHEGRVAPQEEVELTFALRQQNVDRLQKLLRLVSDPESQQYGTETHRFPRSTLTLRSDYVSCTLPCFVPRRKVLDPGGSGVPGQAVSADRESRVDVAAGSWDPKLPHGANTRLLAVHYDC